MQEQDVFIALGGNLGDPAETFNRAIQVIDQRLGKVKKISSFYETLPLKNTEENSPPQPNYLNAVIWIRSTRSPEDLVSIALAIEKELGRTRESETRWQSRVIDIDILAVGATVTSSENLTIPHPEIQNRDFVLVPWAEIAPEFQHPVLKRSVKQLQMEHKALNRKTNIIKVRSSS